MVRLVRLAIQRTTGPITIARKKSLALGAPQDRPASEQLEALLGYPWPFPGRPARYDLTNWTVTDDWPNPVPVTEAEIDVFERWFGNLFDPVS